jgi:hypothetical protein
VHWSASSDTGGDHHPTNAAPMLHQNFEMRLKRHLSLSS